MMSPRWAASSQPKSLDDIELCDPAQTMVSTVRSQSSTWPLQPASASGPDPLDLAAWVYLLGLAVLGSRVGIAAFRLERMKRGSEPLPREVIAGLLPDATLGEELTVRSSRDVRGPFTFGWRHPSVFLPTDWQTWPEPSLRAMLLHEAVHVRRRDHGWALLAAVNRCLHWFNPLSWLAQRRLADCAEYATDDAAARLFGSRTGYAKALLDVNTSPTEQDINEAMAGAICRCTGHIKVKIAIREAAR